MGETDIATDNPLWTFEYNQDTYGWVPEVGNWMFGDEEKTKNG